MRRAIALAFVVLAAVTFAASAETYPSRVVTLVVPYPAGGPTDTIARILADRMAKPLGQPLIVENVGGAGGSIGVGRADQQTPAALAAKQKAEIARWTPIIEESGIKAE